MQGLFITELNIAGDTEVWLTLHRKWCQKSCCIYRTWQATQMQQGSVQTGTQNHSKFRILQQLLDCTFSQRRRNMCTGTIKTYHSEGMTNPLPLRWQAYFSYVIVFRRWFTLKQVQKWQAYFSKLPTYYVIVERGIPGKNAAGSDREITIQLREQWPLNHYSLLSVSSSVHVRNASKTLELVFGIVNHSTYRPFRRSLRSCKQKR